MRRTTWFFVLATGMAGALLFVALTLRSVETTARLEVPAGYLVPKRPAAAPSGGARGSSPREDKCPSDCVNFDAGYAWAQSRSITIEEGCRGRAKPFVEG